MVSYYWVTQTVQLLSYGATTVILAYAKQFPSCIYIRGGVRLELDLVNSSITCCKLRSLLCSRKMGALGGSGQGAAPVPSRGVSLLPPPPCRVRLAVCTTWWQRTYASVTTRYINCIKPVVWYECDALRTDMDRFHKIQWTILPLVYKAEVLLSHLLTECMFWPISRCHLLHRSDGRCFSQIFVRCPSIHLGFRASFRCVLASSYHLSTTDMRLHIVARYKYDTNMTQVDVTCQHMTQYIGSWSRLEFSSAVQLGWLTLEEYTYLVSCMQLIFLICDLVFFLHLVF